MKKFNSALIKKAHKITKMMLEQYRNLDYKTEFGIVMKELLSGYELDLLQEIAMYKDIDWKEWNKYGKNRIYFSYWEGKYNKQCGYYDLNSKKYVLENKYTVQHSLYDLVA
jgi:hypothetical protein